MRAPRIVPVRLRIAVIALAGVALVAPLPPVLVDEIYGRLLFPRLQSVLTGLSNLTSVAWFDLLLLVVIIPFVALAIHDLRRRSLLAALGRVALRVVTIGAVAYLAFLLSWGLNYRREPLRRSVDYKTARVTPAALEQLVREAVSQVNSLHAGAHAEGWPGPGDVDPALARSFQQTLARLHRPSDVRPARPKYSLLDLYFRRAGVSGMTDPYFLETMIASDTLPFERAQTVAHEWAHLAGITDEGEANFVGWLTTVNGSSPTRYSGWLFLYVEAVGGLPRDKAREIAAQLGNGPRADLRAMRERHDREVNPRVAGAGWQVYDGYLKANRVDAGTASYAEVVQLVLGTGLR